MENNTKIFYKKCKYCGKQFMALYEKMAENQRNIHELTCVARKHEPIKSKEDNNVRH